MSTFSFENDQYTRFINQKMATCVVPSSSTAEILFQVAWNADMQVYQKAMSSTVTGLGPET